MKVVGQRPNFFEPRQSKNSEFLEDYMTHFGIPGRIRPDPGSSFIIVIFGEPCRRYL